MMGAKSGVMSASGPLTIDFGIGQERKHVEHAGRQAPSTKSKVGAGVLYFIWDRAMRPSPLTARRLADVHMQLPDTRIGSSHGFIHRSVTIACSGWMYSERANASMLVMRGRGSGDSAEHYVWRYNRDCLSRP